jgi:hypothetical protein
MQSVPIITDVVSSNPIRASCIRYNIMQNDCLYNKEIPSSQIVVN